MRCNWLFPMGPNPEALIIHYCDLCGKMEILAELIRKTGKSPIPKGVCVKVGPESEQMLPWWWKHYSKHNSHPVAFMDGGMSEAMREFCKERGVVLGGGHPTPFSNTLFCDLDCKVLRAFDPVRVVQEDKVAIFQELLRAAAEELLRFY